MVYRHKCNYKKGLSLVGVVVAVFLLVSGAVVTTRLVVEFGRLSNLSREKFIAVNLAREGLELARAVRDTNAFNDPESWTEHLCGGDENGFALNHMTVDQWMNNTAGGSSPLGGGEASSEFSRFDRKIIVGCSADQAYITVESRVEWNHRANQQDRRNVVLIEKLYDWL